MADEAEQRAQLVALLRIQGLDLPEERIDQLLGPHRAHLRGARRLRESMRMTDEPAHVFVPVRWRPDSGGVDDVGGK